MIDVRSSHAPCALLAAICWTATWAPAQIGAPEEASTIRDPADQEACERFLTLRGTQKAMLVARVRGRLSKGDFPAFDRIHALGMDVYECPEAAPAPAFAAEKRRRLPADDGLTRTIQERFARARLLGDMHVHVYYDWQRGEIVQHEVPPGYAQWFENLLNGYPPGTDQAVARVLAALDRDEVQRTHADWFGHAYADLELRVYPGVTLYDAWYSGRIVEVPDLDAIPFAHGVLDTRRYKAPLGGKPRDRLYEAIAERAMAYRKYRTLREAAGAAFVHDDPPMDEIYGRLVPRFHYLFVEHADDLDAVHAVLTGASRDELIEDVDARIADESSDAWGKAEDRREEIRAMRAATRAFALAELEAFAGPARAR